jgi:riboflavin synthase
MGIHNTTIKRVTMTIEEINKKLSHLNPYFEKEEIKELLVARRKLIKQQDKEAK